VALFVLVPFDRIIVLREADVTQ